MLRLLHIDDDLIGREIVRVLFFTVDKPHKIDVAATVKEAIALLADNQYDCIITDLYLPDTLDRSPVMRLKEAAPKVPLIVLSGVDDPKLREECLILGADFFVLKGTASGEELDNIATSVIIRTKRNGGT